MSMLPSKKYQTILTDLKEKIRHAKLKAALSVNRHLLSVYFEIGRTILEQQTVEGWGTKVIDRLAADLKVEFPDMKGLSARNLKYMRAFAEAYPGFRFGDDSIKPPISPSSFVQQDAAQPQGVEIQLVTIVQHAAAQLPWGHHQVILDKAKSSTERAFYIRKCVENNWSRKVLAEQMMARLVDRQGQAITNFHNTLPASQSDLAKETLKNPYVLDFLSMHEAMQERDLENALIQHLKNFMLELGKGFAYVGNQFNLRVDGDDFFLDLLFYNYNLGCFVIIELKLGDFKPEYAGKLNFYINTLDDKIKGMGHKPTIGILLCKTPNETVIRFSLQGIDRPIGVADYQLAEALPKELKSGLPSIAELEAEIDKEYEELKGPTQKRLEALKERIAALKQPVLQAPVTHELLCKAYDESVKPLFRQLLRRLEDFHSDFDSHNFFWSGPTNILGLSDLDSVWRNEDYLKNNRELYFLYRLNGFKPAGVEAFDVSFQFNYLIHNPYWYGFSLTNFNHQQPICKRLYTEQLTPIDVTDICDIICEQVMSEIEARLSFIEKQGE